MKKMKRKVIKLKESDLERLVKKIIKEEKSYINELGGMDEPHPIFGELNFSQLSPEEIEKIMMYVGRNKPTYKTDDGDLEHGTFDTEEDEYRVKGIRPRWMEESEETEVIKPSKNDLSSYKKIMSSKKYNKYK